jgi:hypothetical protein
MWSFIAFFLPSFFFSQLDPLSSTPLMGLLSLKIFSIALCLGQGRLKKQGREPERERAGKKEKERERRMDGWMEV